LTLAPAVLPALRAGNGGYVVNISIVGLPFSGLYCATKFALEDMSESLRLETRPNTAEWQPWRAARQTATRPRPARSNSL
jgi:short-subunit dehydrogenase